MQKQTPTPFFIYLSCRNSCYHQYGNDKTTIRKNKNYHCRIVVSSGKINLKTNMANITLEERLETIEASLELGKSKEEILAEIRSEGLSEEEIKTIAQELERIEEEREKAKKMFRNPFSFKGRIRRLEYGLSFIIYVGVEHICSLIVNSMSASGGTSTIIALLVYALVMIPLMWFYLAQGCKRCHDRDNSGWYQIIPFYGLWMLFADGEAVSNQYGYAPKDR